MHGLGHTSTFPSPPSPQWRMESYINQPRLSKQEASLGHGPVHQWACQYGLNKMLASVVSLKNQPKKGFQKYETCMRCKFAARGVSKAAAILASAFQS